PADLLARGGFSTCPRRGGLSIRHQVQRPAGDRSMRGADRRQFVHVCLSSLRGRPAGGQRPNRGGGDESRNQKGSSATGGFGGIPAAVFEKIVNPILDCAIFVSAASVHFEINCAVSPKPFEKA